ncbi:MAG: hypothetical protein AB8B73_09550 [Ekhidna sp.]
MKKILRVLPVVLFCFLPFVSLLAQETEPKKEVDPYDDYSHLWEEDTKKKKKKKKKGSEAVTTDDLKQTALPLDSLNQNSPVATDSLQNETAPEIPQIPLDTLKPDTVQQEQPKEEVIPEPEVEEPKAEEDAEEKPKKEKKEKKQRDTSNDTPVQDFRAPLASGEPGGNFTGGITYTQIGDENFVGMVLSPEFAIGKVGVGLNVPILYGLESQKIRTEIFKDGVGVARLVRYIRYGQQKVDPVYVKVGELNNTMIGYGGLINQYTNTTSFEKRKVGSHIDLNYKGIFGIEGMYSDFDPTSRNLLALRPYVRPLATTGIPIAKTIEFGAAFVSDKDQTNIPLSDSTSFNYEYTSKGIKAFGLDMGVTLLSVPFIQIDLFATYSKLNIENDSLKAEAMRQLGSDEFKPGNGISAGLNFRFHFIADVLSTDVRIERLSYSDYYLPQFFNATYEINKDARIASLIGAREKKGIYGSLTGHILKTVQLGGSLLIPDDISAESPAVVQINANAERVADKFTLNASYIKGDLTDLGDAFKFDERSLAKVRLIYHLNKFLAAGLDYYWSFAPTADGSFEATKYVMPYFGLSIDF